MASNTSQRKAQSELLRSQVRDHPGGRLWVACRACPKPRTILLAKLPAELTLMRVLVVMRCRHCRGQVVAAVLDDGMVGGHGVGVRLWGPGAHA